MTTKDDIVRHASDYVELSESLIDLKNVTFASPQERVAAATRLNMLTVEARGRLVEAVQTYWEEGDAGS